MRIYIKWLVNSAQALVQKKISEELLNAYFQPITLFTTFFSIIQIFDYFQKLSKKYLFEKKKNTSNIRSLPKSVSTF